MESLAVVGLLDAITSAQAFLEPLGLTFRQYLVILELLNGAPLSVGSLGTTWAWIQA